MKNIYLIKMCLTKYKLDIININKASITAYLRFKSKMR